MAQPIPPAKKFNPITMDLLLRKWFPKLVYREKDLRKIIPKYTRAIGATSIDIIKRWRSHAGLYVLAKAEFGIKNKLTTTIRITIPQRLEDLSSSILF